MKNQTLRIIGGTLKSRQIIFPDIQDISLRPTPNRIRETLFNWISVEVQNAKCLDAFSGTGALGIEAISRGASSCIFFEKNRNVGAYVSKNLSTLNLIQKSTVYLKEFNQKNSKELQGFDLIFLDPPFHQDLLITSLKIISDNSLLNKNGVIYYEVESSFNLNQIQSNWTALKAKKAGDVAYGLLNQTIE